MFYSLFYISLFFSPPTMLPSSSGPVATLADKTDKEKDPDNNKSIDTPE